MIAGDVVQLRDGFGGVVILSGDPDYDSARRVHNLVHDVYPALIVRPHATEDVVRAVRFASKHGLAIAVRGGGHSAAGFGTIEAGMVIDLVSMQEVTVDANSRSARAQGGVTSRKYNAATLPFGLVTPFGDSPSVGIAGLTLGGGAGWLGRKLGLALDSLLAAELVTADGRALRVSATEHPDLFWAIRGGGGNFGIVTSLELRLHPIETILGGILYLPPTSQAIDRVIALTRDAPDELTTISLLMRIPPSSEAHGSLHGQLSLIVMLVWAGDLEAGQRALTALRALAMPMGDAVRPMPISTMYEMFALAAVPIANVSRAFLADTLDPAAIDAMVASMTQRLPSTSAAVIQLRILGGAIARVPVDATAFAHRDAALLVMISALGFAREAFAVERAWVESVFTATRHVATGAYLNFLEAEGEARIHDAYNDTTYRRLAEVKRRYDPDNRFRLNQNIPPAKTWR